jgi:hypothetical protein
LRFGRGTHPYLITGDPESKALATKIEPHWLA